MPNAESLEQNKICFICIACQVAYLHNCKQANTAGEHQRCTRFGQLRKDSTHTRLKPAAAYENIGSVEGPSLAQIECKD